MQGKIKVSYAPICDNDTYQELTIEQLLENEKVLKVLKSEFSKGIRNITVSHQGEAKIILSTQKKIFEFEAEKKDFADLIELAEEDAKAKKLFKKGCQAVEIVDFSTQ